MNWSEHLETPQYLVPVCEITTVLLQLCDGSALAQVTLPRLGMPLCNKTSDGVACPCVSNVLCIFLCCHLTARLSEVMWAGLWDNYFPCHLPRPSLALETFGSVTAPSRQLGEIVRLQLFPA